MKFYRQTSVIMYYKCHSVVYNLCLYLVTVECRTYWCYHEGYVCPSEAPLFLAECCEPLKCLGTLKSKNNYQGHQVLYMDYACTNPNKTVLSLAEMLTQLVSEIRKKQGVDNIESKEETSSQSMLHKDSDLDGNQTVIYSSESLSDFDMNETSTDNYNENNIRPKFYRDLQNESHDKNSNEISESVSESDFDT